MVRSVPAHAFFGKQARPKKSEPEETNGTPHFRDRTYETARGKKGVFRKPCGVFISAGNDGLGALASIERICIGYPFKKVVEPVIARGNIDAETLGRCEELGKTMAAGCDAGIY